ncbi:MAG: (Fe-S)-binding protein [Spirochaetes bacterium]|nr:(Fe-S)-binding protein [Spirochaetota bacterium]
MEILNFKPELCAACATVDCLMKCQYIDIDLEHAREESLRISRGEDSEVLRKCVTCYACEEYCPFGNHPFYRIVDLQEQLDLLPAPRPLAESQVRMMAPRGTISKKPVSFPLVDLCAFPMLKGGIRGSLFSGVSVIDGMDIFCNLMFLHFARSSVIRERLPQITKSISSCYLEEDATREVICYHDECYGTYTSWAPAYGVDVPFRPVHLFQYLHERLLHLKDKIKPLNLTVAYQRPCSARLIPEMEHYVDDIFSLIGVKRAERRYDRGSALCCGGVMEAQQRFELAAENQEKNIADMKQCGATHAVFNCPFCFYTLMGKTMKEGITPVLMVDLCHMALGE